MEIRMLYAERVKLILRQLELQSMVKISDLTELLHVSDDTIRRDLKSMEERGLVRCIRGGACLPAVVDALSRFAGREIANSEKKREAARKAAKYVKTGSVVALNSGTTNVILAQELAGRKDRFTVVSNNLAALNLLMENTNIRLIAVGGEIDPAERSACGADCERLFAQYYPDTAFLSIGAVNCADGFTDCRFSEMGIVRVLAEHAKEVIAVMDSSKLGKRSQAKLLELKDVDRLVTDNALSQTVWQEYREAGLIIE